MATAVTELASGKLLLDEPAEHVARLRISNPAKRGALDPEILDTLADTVRGLDARCLVITGDGKMFSAGYDIGNLDEQQFAERTEKLVAHPFHAALAIKSMEAGLDVLTEKPIAVEVAEADRMVEAAERLGRVLAVNFQHRTRTEVQAARRPSGSAARRCARPGKRRSSSASTNGITSTPLTRKNVSPSESHGASMSAAST